MSSTYGSTGTNGHDEAGTPEPTTVLARPLPETAEHRRERVAAQRSRFGSMKFGSTFFGWVTATGMALLLTALVSAIGLGLGQRSDVAATADSASVATLGTIGSIVGLVIVLVAYFSGGYVAGRMARFNGLRQGLGVWLWSLIAAVVVTVLGAVAQNRFAGLGSLSAVPQLPVNRGDLTTGVIVIAVAVALVSLIGALLGGLAGLNFHRRVDKAELTEI